MSRVDAYDLSPFEKNESRTYSVLVGATCSSEGKTVNKKATYTFNGSTIPSVNKLSCMGWDGNIQLDKIPVSPYLANKISLCDQADKVAPTKCNAWQGNTVFNPECFPTGDGTMNNPYRICTPEQLQEIDNKDGANYILGTDINMAPADNWFGSKGFKSIGRTMYFGFRGSFRGNWFSINNLTIKDGENYSGLFAGAGAGTSGFWIDDLKMNNTTLVNPGENAGTVLGFAPCALVSGVESTQIQIRWARNTTGGMVGQSSYYPLTMIYAKASWAIETNNDINNVGNIGGVVGFSAGSLDVWFVESTVNITARASNIWGLVGYFYGNNNYLHDSITRGSITAKGGTAIGAAVGLCAGGKIENVIASPIGQNKILVEWTGVSYIGGFIGYVPGWEVILNHNSTAYKIQGSPGYQVGWFAGSINTSSALVTRNISTGWIWGTDEKWPFGQCVGGFAGSAAGQYMDNMTTSELYLDKTSAIYGAGGFAGCTWSSTFKRNYTTTHIKINNKGDWIVGGFIGILWDSPGAPFIVTDNFAMWNIIDSVGVSAGTKTTFGWFASSVYNREVNNVFQNNYHHDSRYACTSSGQAVGSNKLNCTYLNRLEPLYDVAHAAYTRSWDAWDFTNTWKAVSGGLPELR